ncbi:mCG147547 [Mus musculus]|nr:mCG147547 [Mus musculus]
MYRAVYLLCDLVLGFYRIATYGMNIFNYNRLLHII